MESDGAPDEGVKLKLGFSKNARFSENERKDIKEHANKFVFLYRIYHHQACKNHLSKIVKNENHVRLIGIRLLKGWLCGDSEVRIGKSMRGFLNRVACGRGVPYHCACRYR